MAITPLPTPPSRDDPANFATRADAFLGALPDFATEANALAVDVNADAAAAAADATAAEAAAAAATAAANVTKWVSGTTYTEGAVVWSPITYLSYRRKSTGGGTTDPSADSANWAQAAGTGDVTLTGTQTLTNKTLTAPVVNTPTVSNAALTTARETTTVSATAATGTINHDALTQSVLYYTANASANFTINVRGNSGTTLNSMMAVGESLTVVFMNTNGATAYYASAFQINGSAVTPKWQGGTAPAAGNANSIDVYTYTIIKTASATFTVLAAQTKFA